MTRNETLTEEQRQSVIATKYEPATMEIEKSHITAFARAIGDDNPLWTDEHAARRSRHGGLIAPPTFTRMIGQALRTRESGVYALPGTVQVDGGSEWNYFEVIRPGDRITLHRRNVDVYVREGSAGPLFFVIGESRFVNQFGETVTTMKSTTIRYAPRASNDGFGHPALSSASTGADIANPIRKERLQWEGVSERDPIGPLVKRTTTQDLVKYAGASRDFHEIHYDKDFALRVGLPGVILHGALKAAYLGQLMTNWIGDSGALKTLGCQHRGMDVPADTVACGGLVVRKYVEHGQHLLDCEIWVENSSGRKTAPGWATVYVS